MRPRSSRDRPRQYLRCREQPHNVKQLFRCWPPCAAKRRHGPPTPLARHSGHDRTPIPGRAADRHCGRCGAFIDLGLIEDVRRQTPQRPARAIIRSDPERMTVAAVERTAQFPLQLDGRDYPAPSNYIQGGCVGDHNPAVPERGDAAGVSASWRKLDPTDHRSSRHRDKKQATRSPPLASIRTAISRQLHRQQRPVPAAQSHRQCRGSIFP